MRFTAEPGVTLVTTGDDVVLLAERLGKLYRTNTTGGAMWHALDRTGGSVDDAAQHVATSLGVDDARVRGDMIEFVRILERVGLGSVSP